MIHSLRNLKTFFSSVWFSGIMLLFAQGAFIPLAAATPAKNGDFGIWTTYDVEKKINSQWKIKAGEELRFREHNGLYYSDTHIAVDYKPWKYLAGGADYLQIRAERYKSQDRNWFWGQVPRIYLTPQISIKGFLLEDRNMLEFRIMEDARFSLWYRNLASVTAPWKWTRLEFQPYTANETFFATQRNGFIEDRFFAGVKVHWWGPVYGTIHYLRHSTKNAAAKWTSLNILGTTLKLCF